MIRALAIADSRFVAESIQRSLRADPGLQVIGYIDARRLAREQILAAGADVVVIDEMTQPGLAIACIRAVRAADPDVKTVVLASRMQTAWLREAVDSGANAAIAKSVHPQGIGMLIREMCSGAVYHAFEQQQELRPARPAPTHQNLTPREFEILKFVSEGASNGEIAGRLWVTEQTVKFHLSNLYRKLGVANRTQAGHYAHVHGLVESASTVVRTLPEAA